MKIKNKGRIWDEMKKMNEKSEAGDGKFTDVLIKIYQLLNIIGGKSDREGYKGRDKNNKRKIWYQVEKKGKGNER